MYDADMISNAIAQRSSILTQKFREFGAKRYGFAMSPPFHRLKGADLAIFNAGFHQTWQRIYLQHGFARVDPILAMAEKRGDTVIPWMKTIEAAARSDAMDHFRRMFLAHQGADGITMSMWGKFGFHGIAYCDIHSSRLVNDQLGIMRLTDEMRAILSSAVDQLIGEVNAAAGLSQRERQVLARLALGETNRQIAWVLDLSPTSVDTYVQRIFTKLGAENRASAVSRGFAAGLITLS